MHMNTITWLKKLIGFDTASDLSNLSLINEIADFLQQQKVEFFLDYNDMANKANLFALFPASDGARDGGIILSGHSDTVPVVKEQWTSDPFVAEERDNKIYGRGACDMKGFLAACLALVPSIKQQKLKKAIYFAFSYDEEVSCLGVPRLLSAIKQRHITPGYCIIGEPTLMKLVVAHKGHHSFRCQFRGIAAHSSVPHRGGNAIIYASYFIQELSRLAELFKCREHDPDFDVPFSTLNIGEIYGGTAVNIVPEQCEVKFDIRNIPQVTLAPIIKEIDAYLRLRIYKRMQAENKNTGYVLTEENMVPAMVASKDPYLLNLMQKLLADARPHKVAFATEGGYFSAAGIPTVVCGPGSIEQAHQVDEYVELSQLKACDQFLADLLHSLT